MGHHLTESGEFKSDKYPDLPAGKIVLSLKDSRAQLGLWVTAVNYAAHDAELSADMMTALSLIGFKPPLIGVETLLDAFREGGILEVRRQQSGNAPPPTPIRLDAAIWLRQAADALVSNRLPSGAVTDAAVATDLRAWADALERGATVRVESASIGATPEGPPASARENPPPNTPQPVTFSRLYDGGAVSGPLVVDIRNGLKQRFLLKGSVSLTFALPPGVGEAALPPGTVEGVAPGSMPPTLLLMFVQDDDGGHTVEWPSDVKWPQSTFEVQERVGRDDDEDESDDEDDEDDEHAVYRTVLGTPEAHLRAIAVYAEPRWTTFYTLALLPSGLYASAPQFFEP